MGLLTEPRQKAVLYLRHSREQAQENSIPIQRERAYRWAAENSIDFVHEAEDAGESGLTADRPGFQALIRDWILNPTKEFKWVIFLDVSRMGRFQNPNEAAHLEYEWSLRGRRVWYIDRGPLPKQPDAMDYLMTMMQRIGAAEHSAKLSDRVWHGCVKISRDGFSAGGSPCYGLERVLLNEQRRFVCALKPGEHKHISNQRVSFRPRNDETTETVQTVFRLFVDQDQLPGAIAPVLNQRRIPSPSGARWQNAAILRILRNEAYIGTRVYNKTWKRLKQPVRANPRSEWIICPDAFPATIPAETFFAAQKRLPLILPSLRCRGQRLIRHMERMLMTEILELLHSSGAAVSPAARFPLVFSIRSVHRSTGWWHFTIPEYLHIFDRVIGVGLEFDQREAVVGYFDIPIADFGHHGVVAFADDDEICRRYRVTKEQVIERIRAVMSGNNGQQDQPADRAPALVITRRHLTSGGSFSP